MLIDTHCPLDFTDFEPERDAVVARAMAAGVKQMITISTRVKRFPEILAIAESYPSVFCSVGTHPHNADEELDIPVSELIELSRHPRVVAIGEAGLDYYYDNAPRDAQVIGLRNHIAAARETGLPLVIHSRSADDDMATILTEEMGKGAFPFLLHCFSSGADLARQAVAMGGYISFSGILTFPKSEDIREIARHVPRDRLLVETDAPYLTPMPHRGRTNASYLVPLTVRTMAEVRGDDLGELCAAIDATTEAAFGGAW